MTSDAELLRRYAERDCQEAFAELVRRHLDLVYSSAQRQMQGDAHLAQDVAQSVFTDLARKAAKLWRHPSLTGWLYTSAYFAASNARRAELRRRVREQEAQTMHELLEATPHEDWEKVRPVLDQAMHELKEHERLAILMRYFENRPFSEIGLQLGLSEDTARKRVDRALAKLQAVLSKRGIATSATLASALSAHAIQQAPAGLASLLTTASLSGAAIHPGILTILFKHMAATKLQTTVLGAIVLASVLTPFALQQQAQARLRVQDESLQQQTNRFAQLEAGTQRLGGLASQTQAVAPSDSAEFREVLRLRNEVSQLQRALRQMTNRAAAASGSPQDQVAILRQRSAVRVAQLKQWLAGHPGESIPEIHVVPEDSWVNSASSLDKDNNFARAMSKLRFDAEISVLSQLHEGWQKYAANHKNPIPANLADLTPYLDLPIDDVVLKRYAIVPGKSLAWPLGDIGEWVLTQAAPVNAELDWRFGYSLNGVNNILDEAVTNRWSVVQ
jgi:RNA polymerase sigma factor (sigma-70 family)